MNNTCKIVINGSDFYIPCDRVNDLDYLDGYLVNVHIIVVSLFVVDILLH